LFHLYQTFSLFNANFETSTLHLKHTKNVRFKMMVNFKAFFQSKKSVQLEPSQGDCEGTWERRRQTTLLWIRRPLLHTLTETENGRIVCVNFINILRANFFVWTLFWQLFSSYMCIEKAARMTFVWKMCT